MLNRVEISNKFGPPAAVRPKNDTLHVVAWNAARGKDWEILFDFVEDPDILILNEMDWGMARSGNTHTTRKMQEQRACMNYVYGVEFLELTNGNVQEINATIGLTNDVGYHGNAVLSKWPIVEAKIVRLHQLYDHLYKAKADRMDAGERRLGGRMALFAITDLGNGRRLLIISAHGHGGAKKQDLESDAQVLCKEINGYSNVSGFFIGGDMSGNLVWKLMQLCGTFALEKTNNYRGRRAVPTWRVDCPNGGPPRARFERGDWLLARGNLTILNTTVQTIHPYRKTPDGKYECVSDHSIISLRARLSP